MTHRGKTVPDAAKAVNARWASLVSSGRTSPAIKPFRAGPETRQQAVAGLEVGDAVAAQGFHVDENVFRALAARQEAEALDAVEPFDHDDLEAADGSATRHGCAPSAIAPDGRRSNSSSDSDAEHLQAPRAVLRLANHLGALRRGLVAVAPQHGDMQEHVGEAVVGHDEAKPLGHVEPFDPTANFDDVRSRIGREFEAGALLCFHDVLGAQ